MRSSLIYLDYENCIRLTTLCEYYSQGNPTLLTYFHSKKANFTSKLPLVSLDCLKTKWGTEIKKGKVTVGKTQTLTVDVTNKIKLASIPTTGTLSLNVLLDSRNIGDAFVLGTPATDVKAYSIDADKMTITLNTAITQGTEIIAIYETESETNARQIRLNAKDLPEMVEIYMEGFVIDENNIKNAVAIKVYKMVVNPKLELNFSAGNATEVEFDGKCLAEKNVEGNPFFSFTLL